MLPAVQAATVLSRSTPRPDDGFIHALTYFKIMLLECSALLEPPPRVYWGILDGASGRSSPKVGAWGLFARVKAALVLPLAPEGPARRSGSASRFHLIQDEAADHRAQNLAGGRARPTPV